MSKVTTNGRNMNELNELKQTPNPGSKEAIEQGCLCPIFDNARGAGIEINGEKCFWMNEHCQLHGNKMRKPGEQDK